MNRVKLAMLTGTSLCLSLGVSYAADLPVKAPVARPVITDPWVGWYVGGNVGYSWGKSNTDTNILPFGTDSIIPNGNSYGFPGAASSTSSKVNGVIGGVQAGYVGRFAPHWLGGIEADIQWSGEKGSAHSPFAGNTIECSSEDCSFAGAHDVTTRLNYFGTFRGKAGYETNGLWIYGTAGLAFGQVSVSGNSTLVTFDNNFGFAPPSVTGTFSIPYSYSQFKGGYAAGVGIEGLIRDTHWRWKLEYLHIDLGSINGGIFGGFFPSVGVNTTRFTDEILRVGFNYKFGDDTPVVAGMPVKAPPPALLAWTGFYAGVNAGYIDSIGRTNTDAAILATGQPGSEAAFSAYNLAYSSTNQFNHHFGGFLGGVQAGYNYQFSSSLVAGLEADIQGTNLRQDRSSTLTAGGVFDPFWVTTTAVSDRLDYIGTVRGRLGVLPTPNLLLYSTGGLAYGGVRSSTQIAFDNTGFGAPTGSGAGSYSGTRFGYAVGGGGEWKFSRNWSAKLEYLYYDLGSVTYATGGYAFDPQATNFRGFGPVAIGTSTTTRFNGNIARIGLNYTFDGGPVVARY